MIETRREAVVVLNRLFVAACSHVAGALKHVEFAPVVSVVGEEDR